MTHRHELHAFDYVNRSYAAVRDVLLASPLTVFRHATTAATLRNDAVGGELHAKIGAIGLTAEVAIDIVAIEAARSPDDRPATKLVIDWRAAHRPRLFPTMRADLTIYAIGPETTQLDLAGTYQPPLGLVGEALDAVAMHRIARDSVTSFVQDVAAFLRGLLATSRA